MAAELRGAQDLGRKQWLAVPSVLSLLISLYSFWQTRKTLMKNEDVA